jgi:hypothetical protein
MFSPAAFRLAEAETIRRALAVARAREVQSANAKINSSRESTDRSSSIYKRAISAPSWLSVKGFLRFGEPDEMKLGTRMSLSHQHYFRSLNEPSDQACLTRRRIVEIDQRVRTVSENGLGICTDVCNPQNVMRNE